jgi:hypothetical protein
LLGFLWVSRFKVNQGSSWVDRFRDIFVIYPEQPRTPNRSRWSTWKRRGWVLPCGSAWVWEGVISARPPPHAVVNCCTAGPTRGPCPHCSPQETGGCGVVGVCHAVAQLIAFLSSCFMAHAPTSTRPSPRHCLEAWHHLNGACCESAVISQCGCVIPDSGSWRLAWNRGERLGAGD